MPIRAYFHPYYILFKIIAFISLLFQGSRFSQKSETQQLAPTVGPWNTSMHEFFYFAEMAQENLPTGVNTGSTKPTLTVDLVTDQGENIIPPPTTTDLRNLLATQHMATRQELKAMGNRMDTIQKENLALGQENLRRKVTTASAEYHTKGRRNQ